MTEAVTATAGRLRRDTGRRTSIRLTVGLTLLGSAVLVTGAVLPWLSLYGGLDHLRGIDGSNGRVLLAAGGLAAVAAVVYAARPSVWIGWAIGAVGVAASGFAAWDLSQLLGTYKQLQADPLALASLGPGAFLTLGGSLLLLGTLLLPQQVRPRFGSPGSASERSTGDVRDLLRAGVIVFLIGSAMIHLAVFGAHLQESALYAAFFAFAAVAQIGLALLFSVRRQRSVLVGTVVLNTAFIAVWVISRTTGLPLGPQPGVPESVSLPDVMATLEEGLAVALAVVAYGLTQMRSMRQDIVRIGATTLGITALVATVVALVAAQG